MSNCWLPSIEKYDTSKFCEWIDYEEFLYKIFSSDFIKNNVYYEKTKVCIRRHPLENNKEEAFYHVTCQDYTKSGSRDPDFRRCERIRWVKAYIDNVNSCSSVFCTGCEGIKIWEEPYKRKERIHILIEEKKYMVVLERRVNYFLLITAFYIDHDHTLKKKLKKYKNYISGQQKTP